MAKPGRKPKGEFGVEERSRFLGLLRSGLGISLALQDLKTNHRRYCLTLRTVKGFRREVKSAISCAQETLVSLRHAAAIEGDAKAQEFLIARNDRGRQFEREMKLRKAELAKQEELLRRLDALENDRAVGTATRRRRTQPPQPDGN